MKKITSKDLSINGIIAALYVVLTLVTYPFSYGAIQVRISEILVLLCFFDLKYAIGVGVGCLISNFCSPIEVFDVIFGTLATVLSCGIVYLCKHLLISLIFPVLINGLVIGLELNILLGEGFLYSFAFVCLGEAIAMIISYLIFLILKRKGILEKVFSKENKKLDFKW